jgi:hypothetical protein
MTRFYDRTPGIGALAPKLLYEDDSGFEPLRAALGRHGDAERTGDHQGKRKPA